MSAVRGAAILERDHPEVAADIHAYVAGINAYIAGRYPLSNEVPFSHIFHHQHRHH
jgi:acyl-homoserine lactone acylase PvdQ